MTQQETVKHEHLKKAGKAVKDVMLALMGREESANTKPKTVGTAISELFVQTAQNVVYGTMAALNPMAAKQMDKTGYDGKRELFAKLAMPSPKSSERSSEINQVAIKETKLIIKSDLEFPKLPKPLRKTA